MTNFPDTIILNTSEIVGALNRNLDVFCIDQVEILDFIDRIITIFTYRDNVSIQLIECINAIKNENRDCFSDPELEIIGQILFQFGTSLFSYLLQIGAYLPNTNTMPYHFSHLVGNDIVLRFSHIGHGE